jgi:drug/metabolite transporter (DMT)-like permease
MVATQTLRKKTYVLLFLMMLFGASGNIILDKGMKDIGALDFSSAAAFLAGFRMVIASPTVWLGTACLLIYLISNMLVLSWADYSYVMPFGAASYFLVPLVGYLWLHEEVPSTRWEGIGFIMMGVYLVSRTPPVTTQPEAQSPGPGPV